jgi:hypothetical protein
VIVIKFCQTNHDAAPHNAESHAFVAKANYAECRVGSETHEVSPIDLNLEARVAIGGHSIALDQWKIESCTFPVLIAASLQIYFAGDQADARDARFDVILIRFIVSGPGNNRGCKKCQEENQDRWRDWSGRTHSYAPFSNSSGLHSFEDLARRTRRRADSKNRALALELSRLTEIHTC